MAGHNWSRVQGHPLDGGWYWTCLACGRKKFCDSEGARLLLEECPKANVNNLPPIVRFP